MSTPPQRQLRFSKNRGTVKPVAGNYRASRVWDFRVLRLRAQGLGFSDPGLCGFRAYKVWALGCRVLCGKCALVSTALRDSSTQLWMSCLRL